MAKVKNLKGHTFGRLTVLRDSKERTKNGRAIWTCLCLCGNFAKGSSESLQSGNKKSCGCLQKEHIQKLIKKNIKHGDSKPPIRIYRIWRHMLDRCYNANGKGYKYYGGKGIKVCKEWKNDYLKFKEWALKNSYQDNLTLDRIDCNKNYSLDNCQWISHHENIKKARFRRCIMQKQLIKALQTRLKQLEAQFNGETLPYRIHDGHHTRDILTTLAVLENKPNAQALLDNMPK